MSAAPSSGQAAEPPIQQRILLTQAEPGMVLAQPVTSGRQSILCAAGTKLNKELIHRLMLLGIKRVIVLGNPAHREQVFSRREKETLLDQRFSRIERPSSLMASIREAVLRHLDEEEA